MYYLFNFIANRTGFAHLTIFALAFMFFKELLD